MLLGVRGGGIIAALGEAMGDLRPVAAESGEAFVINFLTRLPNAQSEVLIERTDSRDAGLESVLAEGEVNLVAIFRPHLNDRSQLFVKERGEGFVKVGQVEIDAHVAGEGHFDQGG